VLVANNLVYMNFGRCLSAFLTAHVWDVNNTCYKNGLREPGTPWGTGEIAFNRCKGCFAINNVVDAWTYSNPYRVEARSKVTFAANVYHGGARNIVPGAVARDPHQLREADPGFVAPPAVDPTAPHQWLNAPTAWSIGTAFTLRGRSPLVDAGVDPHTLPALTADLRQGFDAAMSKDLAGNPRVRGAGWDIGAYEQ
jgi:hypothetical protein